MGLFSRALKAPPNPVDFQKHVDKAAGNGLTEREYKDLKKEYDALGPMRYAASTWLVGRYPELDVTIRDADVNKGWSQYKDLGGAVEGE